MLRFDLPNVHHNAVRVHAFLTMVIAMLALWIHPWFLVLLWAQGLIKGFFGLHRCPMYLWIEKVLFMKNWQGAPEDMGAKMFAAKLLWVASSMAGALYVVGANLWMVPTAMVIGLAMLEWSMGFCIACYAYHYYFKWISK